MARRQVSEGRKALHYAGVGLTVLGMLLFLSTFVTAALNFGDFTDFEDRTRSSMLRAITGMAMMMVGGVLMGLGKGGAAGSGLVLDPERARRDLEPFSRQAGGMIKDAIDEAGFEGRSGGEQQVMVRCLACDHLNEEDSKFCQECGAAIRPPA